MLLSAGSLWGTLHWTPSLTPEARAQALVLLQAFLVMMSITALAVSAAVEERRRALEELSLLNRQLDARGEEIRMYHGLLTHDITNVASALLGLAERLLLQADGPLSDRQEQLLRRMNRQSLEMNRLGENARMLVRIRERGLMPAEGPVIVREALDRAVRLVHDIHFDRSFDVRVDCPLDLTISKLPLLDSILVNLLDNGVRHSPGAERTELQVRVRSEADQTTIAIEGGAPPPPEFVAHLFDRDMKKGRSSGHGIGLMLVREVLQRSGGAIAARSVPREQRDVFQVTLSVPRG
jgi:two-component system sensor histidine kinase KdpD